MADDASEFTEPGPNNDDPQNNPLLFQNANILIQSLLNLTEAINAIREEMVLQRAMNNKGDNPMQSSILG